MSSITWHLEVRMITGLSDMTLCLIKNEGPVSQHVIVWHAKEPSLLKAMSAEHRSKFAALHRQW